MFSVAKLAFLFSFLFLLFFSPFGLAQPIDTTITYYPAPSQTSSFANIVKPNEVLVVFKKNDSTSIEIKDYYTSRRNIPSINIIHGMDGYAGLNLPDTINYSGDKVILYHEGEIIRRDDPCAMYNSNGYCDTLAWRYFNDYIATPIANYLDSTYDSSTGKYLSEQIRYIVLCKGIPIKIWSGDPYWNFNGVNISVDALLSLLKTDRNSNPSIYSLYLSARMSNPYYMLDTALTFDNRFISNHYVNGDWTLSYLVSRLDGESKEDVENLIDRCVNSDKSGSGIWVLDGDPAYQSHNNDINYAKLKLENLGFQTTYNTSSAAILTASGSVIGYTSQGLHASSLDSGYVQNQLDLNYLNGAVFNTYESFNYYSNNPQYSRDDQGLVSEFVHPRPDEEVGTGGVGHTWEPFTSGVIKNRFYFPAYAFGYNMVDAAYLGMPYLGWQNMVVGDPFTTIAWGKQSTIQNTVMKDDNLVTDTITISFGDTLTIVSNTNIDLKHHGFIVSDDARVLLIGSNVTLNSDSWTRGLLLADDNDHPQLLWSTNPSMPIIDYYNVYRKLNSGSWSLIDTVDDYKWTDSSLNFADGIGLTPERVYYYITSQHLSTESTSSNSVSALINKSVHKQNSNNIAKSFNYKLEQNFPNPFNPTTSITYSLEKDEYATLTVYDILGREVAVLIHQKQKSGYHTVNFNASNLPSGVYIYILKAGASITSKKMSLVK